MRSLQVLIVDDEPAIRQVLAATLIKAGHNVDQAANGDQALEKLGHSDFDVAVCDIAMPGMNGIELVRRAGAQGINTTFIMITAFASVDTAIQAMRAGAYDYVTKPLRHEELLHRLEQIGDLRGLKDENRVLRRIVLGDDDNEFISQAPAMQEVHRLIGKVAPTDSTVLITGESGTGKGVVARLLHRQSLRAGQAFIPVNCGAIPENLMESEFFGHAKGAFTGADKATKGLFLQADKGTIFLDEIGELPLALQAKLLHVLEDRTVRPVGGEAPRKVDVRILAATNRNLAEMVAAGKFREDLFFRLGMFHVYVPPLRERRQDVPALVRFLLNKCRRRISHSGEITLDPDVERALLAYDWPGNIRHLEHVIERACILAEDGRVELRDLPTELAGLTPPATQPATEPTSGFLRDQVRRYEGELIHRAIADCGGDRRAAAQRLGIGLSSLYRKLEELEAAGIRLSA
jgi:two-component system response regulator AtoC